MSHEAWCLQEVEVQVEVLEAPRQIQVEAIQEEHVLEVPQDLATQYPTTPSQQVLQERTWAALRGACRTNTTELHWDVIVCMVVVLPWVSCVHCGCQRIAMTCLTSFKGFEVVTCM